MEQFVNDIVTFIKTSGFLGPLACCFLIIIESIFPILPLAVFIALNALFFGNILGFFISWIFTICGCILSYTLFKKKLRKYFDRKLAKDEKVIKFMKGFQNLDFSKLVVITAIPFAPAFLINIIAGLTNMNFRKFLYAILIGKISIVIFWGYIGASFIESFTDPVVLVKVTILVLIAFLISKYISKKYNIE